MIILGECLIYCSLEYVLMSVFIYCAVFMSVKIELRPLEYTEIDLIWSQIDRRELITQMYWQQHDELEAYDCHHDVEAWDKEMLSKDPVILKKAHAQGAAFTGAWSGQQLVGISVVARRSVESMSGAHLLKYFYIDVNHRGLGIGAKLMQAALQSVREFKGNALYISSIPTCNTVDFYIHHGAEVLAEPDPHLFELEPEDVHLLCPVSVM